MLWAADLHLHSRYASRVSRAMTLPAIAAMAQRKGLDVIATGDCLQTDWLKEIEATLEPAEPGFLRLRPEVEATLAKQLPPCLRRPLRFVLSTEVCCAPEGTPELGGLHHLIYFPSVESVRRFWARMVSWGDVLDGRPTLGLDSRYLLEAVLKQGDGCRLVPAHLLNPWYSSLGTVSGERTLKSIFGDLASAVTLVEMGQTSTPSMCRRISVLDHCGLLANSDAHSLENLGREYTLVEAAEDFDALFATLEANRCERVCGWVKFPLPWTRYFLNWCSHCEQPFDAQLCPACRRRLVAGARDRLEIVADRRMPLVPPHAPQAQHLLPLAFVLAALMGTTPDSKSVRWHQNRLRDALGNERYILTEAPQEAIADTSTPQLARMIVAQRSKLLIPRRPEQKANHGEQLSLWP